MSCSYHSGVILGVMVTELGFETERISSKFEIHDKKGNPTGKFEEEVSWKLKFQDKEKSVERIYGEYVEEMVKVKGPLKYLDENYDDWSVDEVFVGISLVSRGYDDWHIVKEIPDYNEQYQMVKDEIKSQFGVDVEPKLYFHFTISC